MTKSHDSNPSFAGPVPQFMKPVDGGIMLFVQLQPGASRSQVIGLFEGRLKIAVKEKAIDGAANEALRRFLSDALEIAKSSVVLIKGEKARQKTVLLKGEENVLQSRLNELLNK